MNRPPVTHRPPVGDPWEEPAHGALRVDLPGGGSALVEARLDSGDLTEYATAGAARVPLETLRGAIRGALDVAQTLVDEVRSTFPEVTAEIHFGVTLEGKVDAKIVSGSAAATFDVTLTVGT